MNNNINQCCRVCGLFYPDFFPWGYDGISPTYDICDCCGVEFGNEDYSAESITSHRDKWIKNGAEWNKEQCRPTNWNIELQLENIGRCAVIEN
jgi:hypothetical protein